MEKAKPPAAKLETCNLLASQQIFYWTLISMLRVQKSESRKKKGVLIQQTKEGIKLNFYFRICKKEEKISFLVLAHILGTRRNDLRILAHKLNTASLRKSVSQSISLD